jgi:hypothetical protein
MLITIVAALLMAELYKKYFLSATRSIARFVLLLLLIFGVGFAAERYVNFFTGTRISEFYEIGRWAEAHPMSKIGMQQSGTASFVAPNVVNLDGKVNPDALSARKSHTMGAYIARERFDYLVDWPEFVSVLAQEASHYNAPYRKVDSLQGLQIYQLVE